jgi:hypothetical protein
VDWSDVTQGRNNGACCYEYDNETWQAEDLLASQGGIMELVNYYLGFVYDLVSEV